MSNYLAESLQEISKEHDDGFAEYPQCPRCSLPMVPTFAFPYKEWACLPCDFAAPFFNGLPKVRRSIKYMDAKTRKWKRELCVIARRIGGAQCAVCDNGSCQRCKDAANEKFKFKYWKSGWYKKQRHTPQSGR